MNAVGRSVGPAHRRTVCTTLRREASPAVSSSTNASRRSGDPRKRNGPPTADPAARRRVVGVVVTLILLAAVGVVLALLALDPAPASVDAQARVHGEAACDLTSKAGEAAEAVQIDSRSRYAAAVLLLDRAIIESARAAESDDALADLDAALRAVHTAGHQGDPHRWEAALDTAIAECGATP